MALGLIDAARKDILAAISRAFARGWSTEHPLGVWLAPHLEQVLSTRQATWNPRVIILAGFTGHSEQLCRPTKSFLPGLLSQKRDIHGLNLRCDFDRGQIDLSCVQNVSQVRLEDNTF